MSQLSNADAIKHWSGIPHDIVAAFGEQGDLARRELLNPAMLSLIGDVTGKTVLDVGCGQGYFARMLAKRGAIVTGVEPAIPFIQYAIEREQDEPLGIQYHQADICAINAKLPLFNVVVANMVLMDIPDLNGAFDACFAALQPDGHLVFSIIHPCFENSDRDYLDHGYLPVQEYFAEYQIPQRWGYRFHRPLSHYLMSCITRGGVIDAVIEPSVDLSATLAVPEMRRHQHVPGFIVVRVRKP
jgi:2-polyprenyl-3-methyl-5-hydroxy-6-metoxy-1,4-benzoquinol methylase